jgi:CHASE2 domain-containing sensor protein
VGATAASLGDRFTSPFVHTEGPDGQQYGEFLSGVEVLANALNTVLRGRSYSETPDWLAALCGALVALLTLGGLSIAQGKWESLKQLGAIVLIGALILGLSYVALARWLIYPPSLAIRSFFKSLKSMLGLAIPGTAMWNAASAKLRARIAMYF